MQLDSLMEQLKSRGIQRVKLAGTDIDGILRGKYVSLEKFASAATNGFGFCDVVFGWDSNDVLYDRSEITGWHTGYPDALARIDLSTCRFVPWEPGTAFCLVDFSHPDGRVLPTCPRQLMKRVVQKAHDMGLTPIMACEYEYFLFRETHLSLHEKGFRDLVLLSPGMFGYSILRASEAGELVPQVLGQMTQYDVEIEGIHTETGPGTYEAAIRYDTALRAADKAVLFKTGMKEIAHRLGLIATFMAKWNQELPGCSGHLHQSLWDADRETNLFADPEQPGQPSELMLYYIGGQLALMPAMTAFFCPTVNSYKRIAPGTYAWAPYNATWGIENRTAAIRAIPGISAKSARIEYRLTGADINPYIAMAASLAAGLYGIEQRLEPPAPLQGSAYEVPDDLFEPLPLTLEQAVERLAESEAVRECLGKEFVEHYLMTRDWEVRQYQRTVTDWELKRYFEII